MVETLFTVKVAEPNTTFPPELPPPFNGPIVSLLPFKFSATPLVFASWTRPVSGNTPAAAAIIVPPFIIVPPKCAFALYRDRFPLPVLMNCPFPEITPLKS